jgi:MoaA/NifB/PqqE/SkfB family radical SAM enzyme
MTKMIKKISIEKFIEGFRNRYSPKSVMFEITHRCNFQCLHCYIPASNRQFNHNEKDTEYIFSLIDQIAEAGCLGLIFSGGEPLIREDFSEIYRYSYYKGFIPVVFTNGSLITSRLLKVFQKYPPFLLRISLYGATSDTYIKVTKTKSCFDQIKENLELLLRRGIHVGLRILITKINVDELPKMVKLAQSLNLPYEVRFDIGPNRINKNNCNLNTKFSQINKIEKRSNLYHRIDYRRNYCSFPIDCPIIDFEGNIYFCPFRPKTNYNLKKDSFIDIYKKISLRLRKIFDNCPFKRR